MRIHIGLAALITFGLTALPADAALKKYAVRARTLAHFSDSSPHVFNVPTQPGAPSSKGVIDESGASPVLKKLVMIGVLRLTTIVPSISGGFIWLNTKSISGPGNNQTGTGSTATSITWGDATGWTITGGSFCQANPSYICSLAKATHETTTDTTLISSHYDIGTWTFHGTGFTATPYISFTSTSDVGNNQVFLRGLERADGTVPALPLLGLGAVGVSLIAMGFSSRRRRG